MRIREPRTTALIFGSGKVSGGLVMDVSFSAWGDVSLFRLLEVPAMFTTFVSIQCANETNLTNFVLFPASPDDRDRSEESRGQHQRGQEVHRHNC